MKVALCAVPMLGHLMPLLPYASELLRRGHTVTIFHDADPKYRRKIEQCGLGACESVTYSSENMKLSGPIFESFQSHYSSSPENKPDVIVYDFFAVDAADAADALGVPAVGVFPNPRSINPWAASQEEQASIKWALWCAVFCKGMEAVLARVLWVNRAWTRRSRSLPMLQEQDLYPSPYMPRPIIGCTSPAIEFPNLPSAPLFHMVGPALPDVADPIDDDLSAWLDVQDKPIVYVAFGTMFHHTVKSVRKLEADLLSLDVAVVWSLPDKDQANLLSTEFPSHWRVRTFSPQVSLFRSGKVSAFVTHCGSNSVAEALLCGVPMICCPGMADQPANASRLAKAGVGFIAKKGKTAAALKQLLDNLARVTHKSKELAYELESHKGAQQAATLIETIAREGATERLYSGPRRWPWWPVALLLTVLPTLLAIFL
jgi:UDP:flavonoid glycosyltransferase YjiC (YdhE family)